MMKNFKIRNVFGIKPTTNHTAAGMDFYIPNIPSVNEMSDETYNTILEAFEKSFNKSREELESTMDKLVLFASAKYGEDIAIKNAMNMLHLYCSLTSNILFNADDPIETFVDVYLTIDNKEVAGMYCTANDHIKINSGIKVKLDPCYAGVFFNKSGKGTKGWDVRACVVDEDYSGYVHTSLAFTSGLEDDSIIYCGDKLVQMLLLQISHPEIEEVDEDEFEKLHADSQRGADGFGSSDVKH